MRLRQTEKWALTVQSLKIIKRIGRYFSGRESGLEVPLEEMFTAAGRLSLAVILGNTDINALSSFEAAYYAVVDGAWRAHRMQTNPSRQGVVKTAFVTGRSKAVANGRVRMTKVAGSAESSGHSDEVQGLRDYEEQLKRVTAARDGTRP